MPVFARLPSGPPSNKVAVLSLCDKFLVQTDRTTSYSYITMDLPDAESWGPYTESIYAMTVGKNRTANMDWKVVCTWTNDGNNLNTPFTDVTSDIITDAQSNHTPITTGFQGRILKFALAAKNTTGSALESQMVWVWVVFTFKS